MSRGECAEVTLVMCCSDAVRVLSRREMIRIKNFRLLTNVIPFEYKDILDDLVWIAVCLGNLDVGVTSTNWKETVGSKRKREAAEEEEGGGAAEATQQDSTDADGSGDMAVDEADAPRVVRKSKRLRGKAAG